MRQPSAILRMIVAASVACASALAIAALPAPTPAEVQAAAAKKAQADAQAEKQKRELADSMDELTQRWRENARANGWPMHPPTPVASESKALDAPAAQTSASGQPGGRLGSAAAQAPKRSEKAGTAPPSEDVKKPRSDRSDNKPAAQ